VDGYGTYRMTLRSFRVLVNWAAITTVIRNH
jgi:hypothetical protein